MGEKLKEFLKNNKSLKQKEIVSLLPNRTLHKYYNGCSPLLFYGNYSKAENVALILSELFIKLTWYGNG